MSNATAAKSKELRFRSFGFLVLASTVIACVCGRPTISTSLRRYSSNWTDNSIPSPARVAIGLKESGASSAGTSDWYGGVARNQHGPTTPFDPAEPDQPKKVHRGGSYLHGPILFSLHRGNAWKGLSQYRHEQPRLLLRDDSRAVASSSTPVDLTTAAPRVSSKKGKSKALEPSVKRAE
jgi:hypothetical protein